MDPQSAVLPQDLLRSLIVPVRGPDPVATQFVQNRRIEAGHHSQQSGNSLFEQELGLARSRNTGVQEQNIRQPAMSDMDLEIDFDLPPDVYPPPAGSMMPIRTVTSGTAPVTVLKKYDYEMYSIEEWDALFPARQQPLKESTQPSKPGKPVPLPPRSTNPEAIPRFNHLCQVHSLTSAFTFEEVEQGLFSSKLAFGNYVYEEAGPFPSKKLAKEAVALRGLSTLETMEAPLPKNTKLASSKTKSSDDDTSDTPDEATGDWVAALHQFAQKHHHSQPQFQYFEVDTREKQQRGLCNSSSQFCCTLSVQARPDHVFGSDTTPHITKAEAKRSAAKEAVTWLQVVGILPASLSTATTNKRRKSSISDDAHTGLAQDASRLRTEHSSSQLVAELSLRLGFTQPQFKCTPTGQNFYVCAAHYLVKDVLRQPQLGGPLCQTDAVFGQKNAKKMCAQELLAVLERLATERGVGQ
jgi:hypothetical protein